MTPSFKENIEKEGKPISEKVWKQLKGEWWEDFWYEEGEKYIDSCGDADKEYIEDFIRDRIHVGIDIKIKDVII